MISLSRLGMILLAIWLILIGLSGFGLVVPAVITSLLAVIAGICLFFANVRVTA